MNSKIYLEIDTKRCEALARLRTGKKVDLGLQLAREARELFVTLPADDPRRGELTAGMAELMLEIGEARDAEALIKESFEIDQDRLDANERGTRYMFLAQLLTNQGRWEEAEEYVQRAIDAPFGEIDFSHDLLRRIRAARQR